ncbi:MULTISPECIES: crotonase/enoyl-CoA hydratase family protein [Zoogloea]|jgi:enoyl-CoA hydratase/carnithine racemase|uniref:Crotonase/enoyl-CoA hydratase family protein n=1 Tax=Zoogloea oleivorans TaxID=1552750 RepID=A0A6C2CZD7_9RHOO|nr:MULTISPECIES: crotonase/enoyl-CoA hydratase family protein [Zoogloea]MDD2668775.1 crotonase/enoyl-CoA hydratase family protein [Zoogloea sp.]MDY0037526.1 crotonase/enoyl-CoA hydratase family protein [Zoogloea oleivorans]TYC58869.1 crotonase/enoyl-CoA hydratase family protein [Zoogloea oleivorans]
MTEQLVKTSQDGVIYTITLARPAKRNAVSDRLLRALDAALNDTPEGTRAIILAGEGDHFCAGLDLAEHQHREPFGVMQHSQWWHRIFQRIQNGGIPVIAALHGAVIGGGLELATATHIRVAEPSTIYQLPEGRHGIFVGGGASVRVAKIIGPGRMCEMMLTGRVIDAEEGQRLGLSHYAVGKGEALAKATELAKRVAENAPMANWAMCTAIGRIDNMATDDGFFVESLTAALTQTSPEVSERIGEFLQRKGKGPRT